MRILVNGCSHTFGSECNTNWVKELALLEGCDYENMALPGTSNQSILRRTIDEIEKHSHRYHVVIISWTTLERFEFAYKGEVTNYSLHKSDAQDDRLNDFFKFCDVNIADWQLGKQHTQMYIFLLQEYLKSKNIPYIFFNAYNTAWDNNQDLLYRSMDFSKYYMPTEGIIERYLAQYPQSFSNTKHATDPEIHKMIAKEIRNSQQWQNR